MPDRSQQQRTSLGEERDPLSEPSPSNPKNQGASGSASKSDLSPSPPLPTPAPTETGLAWATPPPRHCRRPTFDHWSKAEEGRKWRRGRIAGEGRVGGKSRMGSLIKGSGDGHRTLREGPTGGHLGAAINEFESQFHVDVCPTMATFLTLYFRVSELIDIRGSRDGHGPVRV